MSPGTQTPELRNILFALYGDFRCNSASHIHSLCRELSLMGFSCAVAVPSGKETADQLPSLQFQPVLFEEVEEGRFHFPDGRGPDIVHAWTPRELVRKFCRRLSRIYAFRQFVHMEDNEWHILTSLTSRPQAEIEKLSLEQLDAFVPESLSHPVRGREFMKDSAGLTLIMDELRKIVPPEAPSRVFWPSAQQELFFPRPLPKLNGKDLNIPVGNTVIVYPGNVHLANAHEVRSLYLAIAILNREGFPATLVRTGENYCNFLGPDDGWSKPHVIELGTVPRHCVPAVLALADLFVQPGRPDTFNNFRFPSKLPEFLSIGRPVILPATNVGLQMQHGKHAWVLQNANAINIADSIRTIMGDATLYAELTAGALEFFRERLNWKRAAQELAEFYKESPVAKDSTRLLPVKNNYDAVDVPSIDTNIHGLAHHLNADAGSHRKLFIEQT